MTIASDSDMNTDADTATDADTNSFAIQDSQLTSFEGLDKLAVIGGTISLQSVEYPGEVSAFENLETVGGDFEFGDIFGDPIIFHFSEVALTGFDSLSRVDGNFEIASNDGLKAVALPMLQSIGGDFEISYNYALESLSLPNLIAVEGAYWGIESNQNLPNCLATAVFDNLNTGDPQSTCISSNLADSCADIEGGCDS